MSIFIGNVMVGVMVIFMVQIPVVLVTVFIVIAKGQGTIYGESCRMSSLSLVNVTVIVKVIIISYPVIEGNV